jgi:hypothetical protein
MPDDSKADKKLCFVIGPIGDPASETRRHADWVLRGIIKPVFEKHFPDFRVVRADEIVAPGSINSQVITRLMDAPLVIVDMSFHNANAFYELAVRHMKVLPTIHLIHRDWKIPFDVAPYRAVKFSYADPAELEAAQVELRSTVDEVIKPGFQVENPITHARGRLELDQHATPQVKVLLNEIAILRDRVSKVEMAQVTGNLLEIDGSTPRAIVSPGPLLSAATMGLGPLISAEAILCAAEGFRSTELVRAARALLAAGEVRGAQQLLARVKAEEATKDKKNEPPAEGGG